MKLARIVAFLSCFFVSFVVVSATGAELTTQLRRPIALVQAADGERLIVANRDSGSISVINLASREIVAEHAIGKRLADLVAIPGSNQLLAVDEAAHELLLLQPEDDGIRV